MLEVLQFILSDFWRFLGAFLLLYTLSEIIHNLCKFARELFPFTLEGLRRQSLKSIIYKDIVNNDSFEEEDKQELAKKKGIRVNEFIEATKSFKDT